MLTRVYSLPANSLYNIAIMILNKTNLPAVTTAGLQKPADNIYEFPEKVLQFGTGVLLRGLPDYFIDKANRKGIFKGRVVVVKSTGSGSADAFDEQDGLYTLCVQGIEKGTRVEEYIISSAISRVLSAKQQWNEVLQCAHNPELRIIISNTTEVGIMLVKEDIHQQPPASFPAKLLAFLWERFKAFNGSATAGMIIIPTELIVGNGDKLFSIVQELALHNNLGNAFIEWVQTANSFCNSLVDRIVPGKPALDVMKNIEERTGYTDDLLIMCEVYRLWAIEGDEKVKEVLSFAAADDGVIIAPDIEIFRELKLRLLNGTHTLTCGLAFLQGFNTVKDAMADETFGQFVSELMLNEIALAIPGNVTAEEAENFGLQVLDRFRNPYINHQWISITMQYSSKMKMRVVPVLLKFFEQYKKAPRHLSLGFAAYLQFMKAVKKDEDGYKGEWKGNSYIINDDKAAYFFEQWQKYDPADLVVAVLSDTSLWGTNLNELPLFADAVKSNLIQLLKNQSNLLEIETD